MANNNGSKNVGIVNSWSLLAFARAHGKMKVGSFVNKETGEAFKSCAFDDPAGGRVFVGFSSNLGEKNGAWITQNQDDLQVVELASGSYKLCQQGENNWDEVELHI